MSVPGLNQAQRSPDGVKRPHVLLVTCHDLGRYLGCYGVETVETPNLDALAASGLRFTNAFCTAPQCSPSRAALATGRYPHSNGILGLAHPPFGWDLHADERTMAQLLGAAGYQTHLFGFQHIATNAERLGFDDIHGYGEAIECGGEKAKGRRAAEAFRDLILSIPPSQLTYAEINLEEPHRPYDQGGVRPDNSRGVTVPPYLPPGPAAEEEMAALQGAVREADSSVGLILQALQESGRADDTLVVFCADHGLAMPRAKCTLYDVGIEIALLLRWPHGSLEGGRVDDVLVSNVDVLPTVLQLCAVEIPKNVQGRSFAWHLYGRPGEVRECVFAEKTFHSYYDPMRAVRLGNRFKFIRNFEASFAVEVPGDVQEGPIFRQYVELYHGTQHVPVELYDLQADPWEQCNLAAETQHGDTMRFLDELLWRHLEATGDPLLLGPVPSPSFRHAEKAFARFAGEDYA